MLELDRIYCMDCLEGMKQLDSCSVDAVVTDPPYELGFMGKKWDATGISFNVEMWIEALRVLKPGGHLLSFGGSRTYHRMACAIEDAGFEVRDMINWVYGSGFPKSLNIGKQLDGTLGKQGKGFVTAGDDGRKAEFKQTLSFRSDYGYVYEPKTPEALKWFGWGTALKPSHEPIVLARKPLSEKTVAENVLRWGVGGLNIDGCRIGLNHDDFKGKGGGGVHGIGEKIDNKVYGEYEARVDINHSLGRFPANFIHDGSQEVTELFPDSKSSGGWTERAANKIYGGGNGTNTGIVFKPHSDSGSASRFFYCAKVSKNERDMGLDCINVSQGNRPNSPDSTGKFPDHDHRIRGNNHPTVKPLSLMEYLIKLITRENQIVLDPFIGSGTTALACKRINRSFIGFEINPDYCEIAEKRLANIPKRLESFQEVPQ